MSRLLANYNDFVTFEFGPQELWGGPIFHDGIDIVGEDEEGNHLIDDVLCHTAGIVIEAEFDEGRGNHICVQTAPGVYMTYNHLRQIGWAVGDAIPQGAEIGTMWNSGNCTGYHLHFGINDHGEWIDPAPYLESDYTGAEPTPAPTPKDCDVVRTEYVDVLNRMPDESGFANYTQYLANGGTPEGMEAALRSSEEYASLPKVNEALVYFTIKCYWIILGRMPESLGVLQGWCTGENTLENKIAIFNAIWLSEEASAKRG